MLKIQTEDEKLTHTEIRIAFNKSQRADALSREMNNKRSKNAYLTMPVSAFEVEKGNILGPILKESGVSPKDIDTQYLARQLIDFLAERLASGQGASQEEIVARISEHVKLMCPYATDEVCSAVAAKTLDHLANGSNNYKPFVFSFFDREANRMLRYSFRLVEYWQPTIGEDYVYKATSEAVTLFVSMFSIDPILEHAAQNFLIKHLLETGHIAGAVEVAKRASSISTATQAILQNRILELKRNPRKQGWVDDVIPRLETAREHIRTRMNEETALLRTIGEMLEANIDTPDQQEDLISLKDMVEKCSVDHLNLLGQTADAIQTFNSYHAYAFRTPHLSIHISPEEQIIPHIMGMPLGDATNMANNIGCHFLGPREPKVLDLFELFTMFEDTLLRSIRESKTQAPDVVEVAPCSHNEFDAEREEHIRKLVSDYIHQHAITNASDILKSMDNEVCEYDKEDYIAVLHILRSIFRREAKMGIEAEIVDHSLEHRFAIGSNLKLHPTA